MIDRNLWDSDIYVKKYNNLYSNSQNEFKEAVNLLKFNKKDVFVDFGCGNGEFIHYISKKIKYGIGVDTSLVQIKYAYEKLKKVKNIELINTDFLSFKTNLIFTKGFARKSLHHLNDYQKIEFFKKISNFFKKGALFLIYDGIFFDFSKKDLKKNWDNLIKECEIYYGIEWKKKKKDVLYCFKKEYPTGITEWTKAAKAGKFKIIKKGRKSSFYGYILLRRE